MNKLKPLTTKDMKAQFGKYQGKLISWIVENDRPYAEWLARQSNSKTKTKRTAQSLLDKTHGNNCTRSQD